MQIHSGEKPFKRNVFNFRSAFRKNMLVHNSNQQAMNSPYRCTECSYQSPHKARLREHIRTHTGEKPFKCTMCDYRAAVKGNLQTHMRTHTGQKPHKCAKCPYQSSTYGNLVKHMLVHTEESSFPPTGSNDGALQEMALHGQMNMSSSQPEQMYNSHDLDFT